MLNPKLEQNKGRNSRQRKGDGTFLLIDIHKIQRRKVPLNGTFLK
jgi:hypothetical protein